MHKVHISSQKIHVNKMIELLPIYLQRVKGQDCKVQVQQFDFEFDMSVLYNSKQDYNVSTPEYDYQINVCGPLVNGDGDCAGAKKVAACQKNKNHEVVAQAGMEYK